MVLTAGCGMPNGNHAGPGYRPQSLALSPEQELELGREAYAQFLQRADDRVLPNDRPEVKRVQQVLDRLIRASEIRPLQREINLHLEGYHFDWEVSLVQERQINAFSLPGGKMVVFTGILHVVRNDEQLAAVLGHEMAHVLAHHASERIAREGSGVVGVLFGRVYDRRQESEADHIGVFLMTFAGYRPEEAVRFWQEMAQRNQGGQVPAVLSDHPSDAQRIHDLEQWVPAALKGKQAYDAGRIKE
jgi:predicted Zn-dependent protease